MPISNSQDMRYNLESNPGMGMYIRTRLGTDFSSIPVKLLVDSGATMSLLNQRVYDELTDDIRPALHSSNYKIKFANGEVQKALGQAKIPIQIGDFIQTVDFLIGNFTDEAIIGITDLQKLGLKADFEYMTLYRGERSIPIEDNSGIPLSCKVYSKQTISLAPGKTSMVWGSVRNKHGKKQKESAMMLQSVRSVVHKYGVLPAKSHKSIKAVIVVFPYQYSIQMKTQW